MNNKEEIWSFVLEENQIHLVTDDEDSIEAHDVLVDYEDVDQVQ